jgi:hypothetical protein
MFSIARGLLLNSSTMEELSARCQGQGWRQTYFYKGLRKIMVVRPISSACRHSPGRPPALLDRFALPVAGALAMAAGPAAPPARARRGASSHCPRIA